MEKYKEHTGTEACNGGKCNFLLPLSILSLHTSSFHPSDSLSTQANEDEDSQDSSWLSHMGSAPVNQHVSPVGNDGASSSSEVRSHISRLASIDSFDSRW